LQPLDLSGGTTQKHSAGADLGNPLVARHPRVEFTLPVDNFVPIVGKLRSMHRHIDGRMWAWIDQGLGSQMGHHVPVSFLRPPA